MSGRRLIAVLALGLAPIEAQACDYYSVELGEGLTLTYIPAPGLYAFSPENPLYRERYRLEFRGPGPHPFEHKVHIQSLWVGDEVPDGPFLHPKLVAAWFSWRRGDKLPAEHSSVILRADGREIARQDDVLFKGWAHYREDDTSRFINFLDPRPVLFGKHALEVEVRQSDGSVYAFERIRMPRWNRLAKQVAKARIRLKHDAESQGSTKSCGNNPVD